jgi:hypothetical protein
LNPISLVRNQELLPFGVVRHPAPSVFAILLLSVVSAFAANQPPVVSITAPTSGSSFIGPTAIQLNVSATSPDSTIASVAFYQGASKITTVTKAPYQYIWKNVAAGSYSVTAVAKDALGLSSTSSAVALTVTQDQPPVVSLTAPTGGALLIGPATIPLTATAFSPDESITSVTFYQGTTKLGISKTSPYQFSWKSVPAGTYSLTAVATDSLGISTTSAPVSITVKADQPPLVVLTTPVGGFTTIGPATINLAATASSPDETIASVAFFQGTLKIATGKAPPYQFAWKNVAAGTYSLTAVATDTLGISATSAPVSITVSPDQPPVISITTPGNGSTGVAGSTINLAVAVSSPDEAIKSVAYYQGTTRIATVTKAPYGYAWKKVVAGSYSLTAVATDSLGVTTTSTPVSLTVNPDQPPVVSLATPAAGATYVAPASVLLSVLATSPDVTIASVTYYSGSTKIATVSSAPFNYTWKNVAAGSYSVTAVATDSAGGATTSAPRSFTVTSTTSSTVKITSPTNGKAVAAPATVTIVATATAPSGVSSVGFYSGGTLLGTAASSPYQYIWQNIPAGTYNLTAVETDAQGNSVTSAPVTFISDTAPAVLIGTPAAGSTFGAPATINIMASVTDAGKIAKVEFFQGSTLLGTSTVAPYQFSWSAVPIGTYSLTAEAFDSLGVVGTSPAVSVKVISDVPPVITLLTPANALSFSNSSDVSLSYSATDSLSAISKVEIYREGVLVGTLTSPTSGTTWTFTEQNPLPIGSYSYFARAYDGSGTSGDSTLVTVAVIPGLPYLTDFETTDGFAIGPLAGQQEWSVLQGAADVSGVAYSGSQGIQLVAGTPVAIAQEAFAGGANESIVYCDFYAEPVAEAAIASSTVFTAEQAEFGFQQSNGLGVLEVYQGNGSGGGTWVPTSFTIPLGSNNQAQTWVHLTARLDFTRSTWDMYANGNMVAYDIPFKSNNSTYFSSFQIQGDASTDTFVDLLSVGPVNPLFSDANNDGISDNWETQYGLSLALNDRYVNVSGDGIAIVQDYVNNTSPLINTKVTPPPVQSGLVLDLRSDAGVVTGSNGYVSEWLDQSPQGNIATTTTPIGPQLSAGQVNGLPALVFNGVTSLSLPYNMMQNASAGEVIGVVKIGSSPDQFNTLWNLGTYLGSSYINNIHFEDFGNSDSNSVPENASEIAQYYIYDTSIDATGTAIYRYNGFPEWTRKGLAVGFQLYPDIGGFGSGSFVGGIAEVMVYNRALTDAERSSIGSYLLSKYAFPAITVPAAPTDLLAAAVSSDEADLSWTVSSPPMHTVTTILRETGSGGFVQVAQINDALGYTDTGLSPGTSYTYQITIQSYAGTSGTSNSSTATTPSNIADISQSGLLLWLRATVGTEGSGSLSTWADQSGVGNNAVPIDPANPPQVVDNQANGLPVVRFNGANAMILPPNMFQSAQSGQVIAIVKIPNIPNESNTLWNFGTGNGASYNSFGGSTHFDDFGSTDTSSVQEDPNEIAQYYIYDTTIDVNGNSIYRYDGLAEWTKSGLTAGFQQFPNIGGYGNGSLVGDIAEIIVYDRVLSSQEQTTVYAYLANKYALPAALSNLNIPTIVSSANATCQTGQAFTYQITATGNPTSYSASGLPAGLSLDPATGIISGTSTADGTFSVTLTATNSSGSGTLVLTIIFNPALPVIDSATSATGEVGIPFSYQILASAGAFSFDASGLPSGLTVDPVAGIISGIPTDAGTSSVILTASNSAGSGTATLLLTVNQAPSLTSAPTASGQVGQVFSYQVTANGGVTGFSATGLPPGLTIDPVAGLISGTPSAVGIYNVTLSLTNSFGTNQTALTLTIAANFAVTDGMLLWLRADANVVTGTNGAVSQWTDQSALGNNAFQTTTANQPQLIANQVNGLPIIRFSGTNSLVLPYNMMQRVQSGQIIAVVKVGSNPNNFSMLWNFGTGFGTSYYDLLHFDDFGTSDTSYVQIETQAQLSQYFVYDTSLDPSGESIYRYDGSALWTRSGLPLSFQVAPDIGGYNGGSFVGDIAEIFVYDRVLTSQEQGAIYSYLATKYAMPSITTVLGSPAITSSSNVASEVGQPFTFQITANNNPTALAVTGLPVGLSVDATGLITGTPTIAGTYTAMATATNASGTGSSPLNISINFPPPIINASAPPVGQVGQVLSYQIVASNSPTSYTASGLPSGFVLDPIAGVISGLPTTVGVSTINVTATNASGSGSAVLTFTILAASTSPVITSPPAASGQAIQAFNYQIAGTSYPTNFGATGLPAGLTVNSVNGLISGTPAFSGTTTITVFASNSLGTASESVVITISPAGTTNSPVSTGMVLWLEADTGIQMESVNGIATAAWKDQSGQGNDATQSVVQNGSIAAPTSVSNAVNGHSVIHFSGAQQQCLNVSLPSLGASNAGDIFVVVRQSPDGSVSGDPVPGLWQFGPHGTFLSDKNGVSDDFLSQTQFNGKAPVSFTAFNLYNATASGTYWKDSLNGATVVVTNSNPFSSSSGGQIGRAFDNLESGGFGSVNGGYFDGDIAEIVVYNRVLSDQERLAVGQYFASKYALPNVGVPPAPSNLQATGISGTEVYLNWSSPAETYGVIYTIERQQGSGAFVPVGQIQDTLDYVDTNLTPGSTFSYQVVSGSYATGSSAPSNSTSATTLNTSSSIPTSGLELWLRADVGTAGSSASSVGAWGDQSGQNNHAQQFNSALAPTLTANAQNGLPTVHFNAQAGQFLTFPNVLPNASAGEVFVAIRAPQPDLNPAYAFGPNGTGFSSTSNGSSVTNSVSDGFLAATPVTGTVPSNVSFSNFNIYNVSASTGQWIDWINGSYITGGPGGIEHSPTNIPIPQTSSGLLGTDGVVRNVNNFNTPYLYLTGDIAEVIVYNRNLSDSERFTVGQYLQSKYQFSSVVVPTAPTGVTARVDIFGNVDLSWPTTVGAAAYSIERSVDGAPFAVVATVGADGPSGVFVDMDELSGSNVQYEVQALSYSGQSAYSSAASTPAPNAVDPVTGLPFWVEADLGDSALPPPPTQPPTPPSGPPGSSPPVITLTVPSNASLQ